MTNLFQGLSLAIFLMFLPSGVFAHADLITTEPRDGEVINELPKEFVVSYHEDLIPEGTFAVLVKDGEASTLETKVVANQVLITMLPKLASGEYQVQYKTVALDGHPQEGVINFMLIDLEETPMVISPVPAQEIEVVIEQPRLETTSFAPVWAAIAVIFIAFVLLLRLRSKK